MGVGKPEVGQFSVMECKIVKALNRDSASVTRKGVGKGFISKIVKSRNNSDSDR
jgi:hypothetical protein